MIGAEVNVVELLPLVGDCKVNEKPPVMSADGKCSLAFTD